MTMEKIIYFLNNVANDSGSEHLRDVGGLFLIVIPGVLALMIILIGIPKFRGNKSALRFLNIMLYSLCSILPCVLAIHSLIYLNQALIVSVIQELLFFLFYALLYAFLIREFFPWRFYKTDADYLKAFPLPDGHKIITNYLFPDRLKMFNILYAVAISFIIIGSILFIFTSKTSGFKNVGFIFVAIGCFYWLFFLVFIRRFLVCPVCHRNVYGFEKANMKTYFICTIRRIFQYHCFTCMYCFAHIKVGKRDIIKEKNLEIINMHQPDFEVRKKK
jgi:hypothetical protein